MCRTDEGVWPAGRDIPGLCRRVASVLSAALLGLLAVSCIGKGSLQTMAQQPRYEPLENGDYFPDQSSTQGEQPDTVPRGEVRDDTLLFTGRVNGREADVFPFPITRDVLQRGQERFNIYCAPCHDYTGSGNGLIVRAGFPHPPSFHEQRLRDLPVGIIFEVITSGIGQMPAYGPQVPARDRWAIIAYIRALQLSQNARIEDVPADQRGQLGQAPK